MAFIGNQPTAVPLTSSQLVDGIITTAKIADGAVVNVDVNSTAAIAYSKLNLATSIVNGDIANATINLTQKVTGTLPTANGGTGLAALGTAGQALVVNSTATALEFATVGATAGQVIQVVSTFKADVFTSSSTSYVDVTGLSVSITPSSSSNKILVIVTTNHSNGANDFLMQLVRNSTVIGNGTSGTVTNGFSMYSSGAAVNSMMASCINFLDSPSTTSSTTYKIQVLGNSGTTYVNRRSSNDAFGGSSTITVMEIAG
jgi:hypothetical protein